MAKIRSLKKLIEYFESIPANKWCKGSYSKHGRHCALGHLYWNTDKPLISCAREHTEGLTLINDSAKNGIKKAVLEFLHRKYESRKK